MRIMELAVIPQGLKPWGFKGLLGTTEVVPCYKAYFRNKL